MPITDKNGTAISDGAAGYLTCFLRFSISIFHKCNIARILAVQQILHQVCGLLFRHVLWVAIGALQKCRIRMPQQGCRHLFAGAFLQQIGCVEMPQGMQVVEAQNYSSNEYESPRSNGWRLCRNLLLPTSFFLPLWLRHPTPMGMLQKM